MYGEKLIEEKAEGNKIIRTSEFKNFEHNYLELIQNINDYITDDWEALADHQIFFDRNEDFTSFVVDDLLEWVGELIDDKRFDEEEEETYGWLTKWVKPLQEAKGYTIHLNWKPEWVNKLVRGTKK